MVLSDSAARALSFQPVNWVERVAPYQVAEIEQLAATLAVPVASDSAVAENPAQQLQYQFGDVSLRLLAIYHEQEAIAVFSASGIPEQTKPVVQVRLGQQLGDIEILAISANTVTVRYQQQDTILQLFKPQPEQLNTADSGKPRE